MAMFKFMLLALLSIPAQAYVIPVHRNSQLLRKKFAHDSRLKQGHVQILAARIAKRNPQAIQTFSYNSRLINNDGNPHLISAQDINYYAPGSTIKIIMAAQAVATMESLGFSLNAKVSGTPFYHLLRGSLVDSSNGYANTLAYIVGADSLNSRARNYLGFPNFALNRAMGFEYPGVDGPALNVTEAERSLTLRSTFQHELFPVRGVNGKLDNYISQESLLKSMVKLVQPELFNSKTRYPISQQARLTLLNLLGQNPENKPANWCHFFIDAYKQRKERFASHHSKCGVSPRSMGGVMYSDVAYFAPESSNPYHTYLFMTAKYAAFSSEDELLEYFTKLSGQVLDLLQ